MLSVEKHSRTRKAPRITYRITASASASARPCSTSFTVSRSAKRCIVSSTSCRPIDVWIHEYNEARPHQETQMQTFLDAMPMTKEKIARNNVRLYDAILPCPPKASGTSASTRYATVVVLRANYPPTISISGSGKMNLAPRAKVSASRWTNSSRKCQGSTR
jgi:hypothetical protein